MKRLFAMLLVLIMLLSALPMTVFAEEAEIAATSVAGSSKDDPLIVNNYADLKAALESEGTLYIRVNTFKNTTGLNYYALRENEDYNNASPAITMRGTKYLEVNTAINCTATSVNCLLYAFIMCYGDLHISGNGSINVSFNAYYMNAIIHVRTPGELTVDGSVTFDPESKSVDAHGRAVFLESGRITLNDGVYKGFGSHNESKQNGAQAVYIHYTDNCYATINGGQYYATYGGKNYGLWNANDHTVLNGGIFRGIYNDFNFTDKKLSDLLGQNCRYRDVNTGSDFDGSEVSKTEVTLEVYKTYTVSGTATSFLDDNGQVTVRFEKKGNFLWSVIGVKFLTGNSGTFQFNNVAAGANYRIAVSKANHVAREYSFTVSGNMTQDVKIHPLGDIDGDGAVNNFDYGRVNSHARNKSKLTDYAFLCADIDGDGYVNNFDAGRINSHARGKSSLWT